MKFTVQIFGGNSEQFPDLLRKIASEIEDGKTCENHLEESCSYNYCLEEESYHRKFMIYSSNHVSIPSTDPKILGIAFGSSHHEAFEGFCQTENGQNKLSSNIAGNITIREIIGDPVYKETVEIK